MEAMLESPVMIGAHSVLFLAARCETLAPTC